MVALVISGDQPSLQQLQHVIESVPSASTESCHRLSPIWGSPIRTVDPLLRAPYAFKHFLGPQSFVEFRYASFATDPRFETIIARSMGF
jgi:hypothetical protein